jgi:hypothetical protein
MQTLLTTRPATPAVLRRGTVAAAIASLAACGGGNGTPAPEAAVLAGQSYKGPAAGATVCLYRIDAAAAGGRGAPVPAQAGSTPGLDGNGCVVTGDDGRWSAVLPAGTRGELLVESTGGTWCSDESVPVGGTCGGGATAVAMGSLRLRTVATVGAGGTLAAPLTLLTTAAVQAAAPLDAGSFRASYAAIARRMGLDGGEAGAEPGEGLLGALLRRLGGYLGGDSGAGETVVGQIAGGQLQAPGGELAPPEVVACAAMDDDGPVRTDLVGLYACRDNPGGGFTTTQWSFFWSEALAGGAPVEGSYHEYRYEGRCSTGGPFVDSLTLPMTVRAAGAVALPLQASADPARAQSGRATRLEFAVQGDAGAGIPARTVRQLACRLPRDDGGRPYLHLSATGGPLQGGWPTRIEPRVTWETSFYD